MLAKGTSAHGKVVKEWGKKVTKKDGSINREALGAIIFSDPAARKKLNGITHPAIGFKIFVQIMIAMFKGADG